MRAFLNHGRAGSPMSTEEVPVKSAPMAHHVRGLSWTRSGYGTRIPTELMVMVDRRWRRVYACQISNASTLFVGKALSSGLIVSIDR